MRGLEHMGGRYHINLGGDLNDEKKTKLLYTLALDGRQTIILHATTNQKQAPIMEESRERRQDYRGAWGGVNPSFLATIEAGVL